MKLSLPVLLSVNGGYVDSAGFLALQGLFSAHVTGNFVTLGAALVLGSTGVVAKLIAWGGDRDEAIARMKRALGMFVVEGIYTSIPLHERILSHPDFVEGRLDTGFLARIGVGEKK